LRRRDTQSVFREGALPIDLRSRIVHFRVCDVYIPDPASVLIEMHGNDLLQGRVIDQSEDGTSEGSFAMVEVEDLQQPLIVPIARILGAL
jgi:hypothetical protein